MSHSMRHPHDLPFGYAIVQPCVTDDGGTDMVALCVFCLLS